VRYRLLYSETSRQQIRKLHPQIKPQIKNRLEQISDSPYIGKYLERDLSGYLSFRARRYRIIYKIRENEKAVEVHYVSHRKDIYELFGDQVRDR
jgi:mRNA-degrading endonuclease RelE of RelBE toxin-antitoxin system